MAQRSRVYTIYLVPDDQRKPFTLKVRAGIVRVLAGAIILFVLGVLVLIFRAGEIAAKMQLVPYLRSENKRLREDNEQIHQLRARIEKLGQFNAYLEQLVGLSSNELANRMMMAQPTPSDTDLVAMTHAFSQPASAIRSPADSALAQQGVPFISPVQGWVTRTFSPDTSDPAQKHYGIDFAAATGTPIRATAPGIVDDVARDEYLGKMVTIRHANGFITRYGHCLQILVTRGAAVKRGQTIATVGNTGRSSAPHLHYEVLKNGKYVNPQRYIVD